jgi:UDP-N-acetylmuramoyl-tripeptide--D-alanyl-D-alanine ligase
MDSLTVSSVTSGASRGPVAVFSGYSIDSRQVVEGDLFIALRGPNHDGHEFVSQALAVAAGAIVSQPADSFAVPEGKSLIEVADSLVALRGLSRHVIDTLRPRVVAVTGSVGKTTTKEIAAAILSECFAVAKSEGNRNNGIGLPLEVTGMPEGTEVAVLEMGMSTPGEIRLLSDLVRPSIGIVTAVEPAHLGNFKSVDEIQEAKAEILSGMGPDSVVVANADDPRSLAIGKRHRGRVLRYGLSGDPGLDSTIQDLVESPGRTSFVLSLQGQSARVDLPLPGRHNVSNFLAAAAAASVLGVSASYASRAALSLHPVRHRGEIRTLGGDLLIYDDSYNSSPAALRAAWLAFTTAAGSRRRIAVVGEMRELGPGSRDLHREAGERLRSAFSILVAVGGDAAALAEGAKAGPGEVHFVENAAEAQAFLAGRLRPADALFVKGSRGVGLDRVVDAVTANRGGPQR